MVILDANENDSNKQHHQQHQVVVIKEHFRTQHGVAVSVEPQVQATATVSEYRHIDAVNNVEPSKFFQSIILNPTVRVPPRHSPNEIKSKEAITPCTVLAAQLNDAETIQRLSTAGVDLNLTDRFGYSALAWSIILNHREAARALISCGANIEVHAPCGGRRNPVQHAAASGSSEILSDLLCALWSQAIKLKFRTKSNNFYLDDNEHVDLFDSSHVEWFRPFSDALELKGWENGTPFYLALGLKNGSSTDNIKRVLQIAKSKVEEWKAVWPCMKTISREENNRKPFSSSYTIGEKTPVLLENISKNCLERMDWCHFCGSLIHSDGLVFHILNLCEQREVQCGYARVGCVEVLNAKDMRLHMTYHCKWRPIYCLRGCGAQIRHNEQQAHDVQICSLAPILCPLGCNELIQRKSLREHRATCKCHMLPCNAGCGKLFSMVDILSHEMDCKSSCTCQCGINYGSKPNREYHENVECSLRSVVCTKCGKRDITAKQLAHHLDNSCEFRIVNCQECGMSLPYVDIYHHSLVEGGECPYRLLRYRLEWVNRRILIPTPTTSTTTTSTTTGEREQTPSSVAVVKKYIIDNDSYEILLPGNGVNIMRLDAFCTRGGTGEPEVYTVGDNEEEGHHHADGDGWTCGQLYACEMKDHIAFKCPFRIVSCPLGCGKQLQEKDVEIHRDQQCLFRQVKCQGCCKFLSLSTLDSHKMNDCPKGLVTCPLSCGEMLRIKDSAHHMSNDCPRRIITCPLGCPAKYLLAEQLDEHKLTSCSKVSEYVWRKHSCCDVDDHLTSSCPKRKLKCGCGVNTTVVDHPTHLALECCKEEVPCDLGCGKVLLRDQIMNKPPSDAYTYHLKGELDSHKNPLDGTCPRRMLPDLESWQECTLGCHMLVKRRLAIQHRSKECPRRLVTCRVGCNSQVLAVDAIRHGETCDLPRIPCGAGSDDCARQLRTWMTDGQLQFCSTHRSNPLFWAAARGNEENRLLSYIIHSLRKDNLSSIVDCEDWMGMTPLTTAAQKGCESSVVLLLEIGKASVNLETFTGRVALSEAARYGHMNVVKILLEFGAEVEMKFAKGGCSALWWSKRMRNDPLEKFLEREIKASTKRRSVMISISRGDCKSVASVVTGGEAHRINHVASLEFEFHEAKFLMGKCLDRVKKLQIEEQQYLENVNSSQGDETKVIHRNRHGMLMEDNDATRAKLVDLHRVVEKIERKLHVELLINRMDSTGHTLASWAASHGQIGILEDLLANGATLHHGPMYQKACVEFIQLVFRQWRSSRLIKGDTDVAAAPNAVQKKLSSVFNAIRRSRAVRRMHQTREAQRSPVCEAAFNGQHALIRSLKSQIRPRDCRTWLVPCPPHASPVWQHHNVVAHEYLPLGFPKRVIGLLECAQLYAHIRPRKTMTAAGDWLNVDHPCNDLQVLRTLVEGLEADFIESNIIQRRKMAEQIKERRIKALKFCRWKCGKSFSSSQGCIEHEGLCPLKLVTCPNEGCEEKGLQQRNLKRHTRELCSSRNVQCKCGQDILAKDMNLHEERMCPLRLIDCPKCNTKVMCNLRNIHDSETCPKRLLECPHGCGERVTSEDMERHASKEDGCCTHRPTKCELGCGAIIQHRLQQEHAALQCKERIVNCRWKCNERVRAKHLIDHEMTVCSLRQVPYPRGCGILKVINSNEEWENHLSNDCTRRWVTCPRSGCNRRVWVSLVESHLNTECPKRVVVCREGCGEYFPAEASDAHARFGCTLRVRKCPHGCGEKLKEEKIQLHLDKVCPRRIISCLHDSCHERLPADEMGRHMHLECPNRTVRCWQGCEAMLWASKLQNHHQTLCPMRYIPCRLGCGQRIRFCDQLKHGKEDCCIVTTTQCKIRE